MTFKVGDKVKCIRHDDCEFLKSREVFVVVNTYIGFGGVRYLTLEDNQGRGHGWDPSRFELVPPEKTNEGLAKTLREARKEYFQALRALNKRGYTVKVEGYEMYPGRDDENLTITKVVTTTEEL